MQSIQEKLKEGKILQDATQKKEIKPYPRAPKVNNFVARRDKGDHISDYQEKK